MLLSSKGKKKMTTKEIERVEKLGGKKTSIDGCARWTWDDGSVAIDWYEEKLISGVYAQIPGTSSDYKRLCRKAAEK